MILPPPEHGLPWPEWRPNQAEAVEAILHSDAPFTLLRAPVGSGKSAIALALQAVSEKKMLVLTSSRELQDQYLRDAKDAERYKDGGMTRVKGRSNYACLLPGFRNAEQAPCTDGEPCPYRYTEGPRMCGYYAALRDAAGAEVVALNYAYAVLALNYAGVFRPYGPDSGMADIVERPFHHRHWLVCDEGHDLDDVLSQVFSITIDSVTLDRHHIPRPASNPSWPDVVAWAQTYYDIVRAVHTERQAHEPDAADGLRTLVRHTKSVLERTAIPHIPHQNGQVLTCTPVWVRDLAPRHLFRYAQRMVIMSATLPDFAFLAWSLGIEEENYLPIDVPSTWPSSNRPVFFWPIAPMGARHEQESLPNVVRGIDLLLDKHIAQKGLIHTVSYARQRDIYHLSNRKDRLLCPTPGELPGALARLRESWEPLVLLSPSVHQGVNLPYIVGFQVIPKVPFPNLGDLRIRAQKADQPMSYIARTIGTMVQAYGRATRSPDQASTTYILDSDFSWLWRGNRTRFGRFFGDALREVSMTY